MDEYIEKYAAIKELQMVCTQSSGGPDAVEAVNYTLNYCKEKVAAIPSADVAPVRHGHWEVLEHYRDGDTAERCSQCRALIFFRCKTPKNYCPNCGAKMDGEVGDNAKN